LKLIKSTIVLLFMLAACNSQGSEQEVNDAVKAYVLSSGKPHKLRSVYGVDLPSDGFDSFYIYPSIISGELNVSPFVYFDEKTKKSTGDSYTRCNIVMSFHGGVLIAPRQFVADDAKNSTPCFGFDKKISIVKNRSGSWIIVNALYQGMSGDPEIIPEVYSFDGKKLCYSDSASLALESGKISVKKLVDEIISINKYDECSG